MITLNGKKFAENETEFIESLFSSTGTCVGYARAYKNRDIILSDHNKERIAVINWDNVLCNARKLSPGKYWYSYADIDIIGRYDFTLQQAEIRAAKAQMLNI